jgi:hypothetical protein
VDLPSVILLLLSEYAITIMPISSRSYRSHVISYQQKQLG